MLSLANFVSHTTTNILSAFICQFWVCIIRAPLIWIPNCTIKLPIVMSNSSDEMLKCSVRLWSLSQALNVSTATSTFCDFCGALCGSFRWARARKDIALLRVFPSGGLDWIFLELFCELFRLSWLKKYILRYSNSVQTDEYFFMLWLMNCWMANNKSVHYFAELQVNETLKRKSIVWNGK